MTTLNEIVSSSKPICLDKEGRVEFVNDELAPIVPLARPALGEPTFFYSGIFCKYGIGCDKDPAKAFQFFKKAAYQGFKESPYAHDREELPQESGVGLPEARYILGRCFERGEGVLTKNQDKATRCYKDCIELVKDRNAPEAYYLLGLCYEFGRGVPRSLERAQEYYNQVALLARTPDLKKAAETRQAQLCAQKSKD